MFNEVIYLITKTDKSYDADGFEIDSEEHKTKCFASIKSASYREYFEALKVDEIVSDIFTVDQRDYNLSMFVNNEGIKVKPSLVEFDGARYRIVRRYRRSGTSGNYTIELTCKEVE